MTGVETALAVAAVASAVAGTAVSTMAAREQSKYQAAVADMNAEIEAQNAKRATDRAFAEAQEQDRVNAGVFGEMESRQSGSGLSARSGSFALARKGARTLGRLDTLNVAQSGFIDAYNARTRQSQFKADAGAAKAAGRNATLSGAITGIGQVAGGLAQPLSSGQSVGSSLIGGSSSSIRTAGPRRFTYKG